ncbi:DUF1627 domain-containing protein [Escherichia coli O170:H18]|uniref:DUF1627 domain-containing protein n=1 Tax=Escherichia coli TaxID=562 RepID=UPI001C1FFDDF|nr:DUF1627 domain-containing protein [Escherichia coli]EEQ5902629.1 DUF1627 domain-containing protein [Escherichia coli]EKY6397875.1 DUF1627 domain-containing protein [Escherichia coli]QWV75205.1 DUF1627 domain-containing protein [Escherichia coli O170:H18]
METVSDALKALKRASSHVVAARLGISREEAVNELWKLKRRGEADSKGAMWWLTNAPTEVPEETVTVTKITEHELTAMISQRGPQTVDDMAMLFSTTSRKVVSTLAYALNKGRLIRVNQNGKFLYCMPGDKLPAEPRVASVAKNDGKAFPQPAGVALPVQETTTQDEIKTETVADIVQSLPSFSETRADDLILPSLHMANRELRRAKSDVQKWERVCAALRELNKHRDILRDITATREQQQ